VFHAHLLRWIVAMVSLSVYQESDVLSLHADFIKLKRRVCVFACLLFPR
jgi:hypothetical protein